MITTLEVLTPEDFEAWVLRLAGIFPSPERCPVCEGELEVRGAAVPSSGEALTCRECAAGGWPLSSEAIAFLRRIDHESLRRLSRNPPSAAALAECEEASGRVRRAFFVPSLFLPTHQPTNCAPGIGLRLRSKYQSQLCQQIA